MISSMCSALPIRLVNLLRSHDGSRRSLILILILIAVSLAFATPAAAMRRLAFVVGVNTYTNLPEYRQLKNSVNDAVAIAGALKQLNYIVASGHDLTRSQFYASWQFFLEQIREHDIVAIFLSGHGVEIEGQNFILPRDVPYVEFGRQEQQKSHSISVSELLLDIRRRSPSVAFIILDACRENPFIPAEYRKGSANPGGLAKMEAVQGEFIMYSAAAQQISLDRLPGDDPIRHSVYVRHLLPLMHQPNLTLHELARRLRDRVVRATEGILPSPQWPVYYDGLRGNFCLNECTEESLDDGGKQKAQVATDRKLSDASRRLIECYLAGRDDWENCE